MSLKQHNDIVEKLLKQIDTKDSQIESLKKQLHKTGGVNAIQIKSIDNEKEVSKKVVQLHKEYKQKINVLQQQIRSRSIQNKDLKERMNTLKKLQAKQKQQALEILKKTANMASYDPKFAAVVSHYQSQIQRKDKYIGNLQKQIKQNFYKMKLNGIESKSNEIENEQQNDGLANENNLQLNKKMPQLLNQENYHTKYQQQINGLKIENSKLQRLFDQKSKQFKDLTKRYADLTKQYYRIVNQYAEKDVHIPTQKQTSKGNQLNNRNVNKKSGTGIGNILQEMIEDCDNSQTYSQQSLSYSFLSNYHKCPGGKQSVLLNNGQSELESANSLLKNIQQLLEANNKMQIIPKLTKMKNKAEQSEIFENISKFIHSMLYRLGMGKLPMSSIITQLEKLQGRIGKLMQSSDLLDQLCIQVGAKKDKILQKILDLKATQQQFFNNMKDVDFMQKLPKSNKIVQFINYFELDKQQCELPEQLKKMYEQLKYVDRFLKQSAIILNKEPQGLERSFQAILRYLERKEAEKELTRQEKTEKTTKKSK